MTKWEELGDCWVPVDVSTKQGGTRHERQVEISLKFSWSNVNEELAGELFSYKDFDVPDGTEVIDHRNAKLRLVETFGKPVLEPKSETVPKREAGRVVFLLANLVVIGACVFWFIRRRVT